MEETFKGKGEFLPPPKNELVSGLEGSTGYSEPTPADGEGSEEEAHGKRNSDLKRVLHEKLAQLEHLNEAAIVKYIKENKPMTEDKAKSS